MEKKENVEYSKLPDFSSLSKEQLYILDIYHKINPDFCKKQLGGLYGNINDLQDKEIIKSVFGNKVLDVGSGLGTLSYRLKKSKYDVTSIEPNEDSSKIAKELFNIDSLPYSIYNTPFSDNEFDTVIFRECVEHLDFELLLPELNRICSKRVIIFQTNLNFLTRSLRTRGDHEEFNTRELDHYQNSLNKFGFKEQSVKYRDPIAFPISGGYHCKQLIPKNNFLENRILDIDIFANKILNYLSISKYFCWRYLLVADK